MNKKEIIISLVKIFEVADLDRADIEKAVSILTYLDEEKKQNAKYKENARAKERIIADYHFGYRALINHMKEQKENMALLKAAAIQMEKEYLGLFELNYYELYFYLVKYAPKAVFAILTRDALRKYWLGEKANKKIYESIKTSLLVSAHAKKILGADLKVVKRNTQAMWDPIEKPEVNVMVISIKNGTFIKNAGNFSEKLGYDDVEGKLLKLNGLEYQCNNARYELLYMEV